MARNYAALPHEYFGEMAELTDEEFGRLCRALLRYSMGEQVPEPVGNERFYLHRIMAQEDRYQASYDELTQKRSEAGKKAAAARWGCDRIPTDASDNNTNTKTNTETETKPKQNYTTSSRRAGGKEQAAKAAMEERMRKDMEWLERFALEQERERTEAAV